MVLTLAGTSIATFSAALVTGNSHAAATTSPQELPKKGELQLSGTVLDVDAVKGSLTISANKFTLPSGKSNSITPNKNKTVFIGAGARIHLAGSTKPASLTGIVVPGSKVTVTGVDGGSGKPLLAREIVVTANAPLAEGADSTPPVSRLLPGGAEIGALKVVKLLDQPGDSNVSAADAAGDVAITLKSSNGSSYNFLYLNGRIEPVTGPYVNISALNSRDQFVGQAPAQDGESEFPILVTGGVRDKLRGLASVTGINSNGTIIGNTLGRGRAVVFEQGKLRVLTSGVAELNSRAEAINDSSLVAGSVTDLQNQTRAMVRSTVRLQILGTLGGKNSRARGISPKGVVVGEADLNADTHHAFLFEGTKMIDLGTLNAAQSSARAVNDFGQVVGSCETSTPGAAPSATPFLYDHGKMKDLNDLLQDRDQDWTVVEAIGITNSGQIAATANYNGVPQAVLLLPVPADNLTQKPTENEAP